MNPDKPLPPGVCFLVILGSSILGWLALARFLFVMARHAA